MVKPLTFLAELFRMAAVTEQRYGSLYMTLDNLTRDAAEKDEQGGSVSGGAIAAVQSFMELLGIAFSGTKFHSSIRASDNWLIDWSIEWWMWNYQMPFSFHWSIDRMIDWLIDWLSHWPIDGWIDWFDWFDELLQNIFLGSNFRIISMIFELLFFSFRGSQKAPQIFPCFYSQRGCQEQGTRWVEHGRCDDKGVAHSECLVSQPWMHDANYRE